MLIDIEQISFKSPRGFIVLEGVNGAGKSSLQDKLENYAAARGAKVLKTFEPGATPAGKLLRKILLEAKQQPLHPMAEVFLFCADRSEHAAKVIAPALQQGQLVISDRYYYSTMAFQGYGRELDLKLLLNLNLTAIAGLLPDLVILLDLDPQEGLQRNSGKASLPQRGAGDAFEQENLAFHRRLRQGFLEMAKSLPEPFLVIDAAQSAQTVFETAKQAVDRLLAHLK